MPLNFILPFLASIIMFAFTVIVIWRYLKRRTLHLLFWGLGLAMFGVATFAEAYLALAWNPWMFFTWYLFGAALTAGWIGQGTVYLLLHKRWAHALTAVLILGSLITTALMLQVMPKLDASRFIPAHPISEQYRTIMPPIEAGATVRLTTPFFNIYGLITLGGGALWSAYLLWRKRALPSRVIANVLIAAGAFSVGLTGTLTRLGYGSLLYLGELFAATLMFAGFMLAARPQPQGAASPAPARQMSPNA